MEQFEKNNLFKYFSYEEFYKLCMLDDLYLKAKIIVFELFKDKVDKAGKPYIGHLIRVSERLIDPTERIAGLLHDILEDTEITYNDLLEVGFSKEILDIVEIVSHTEKSKNNLSKREKLLIYYSVIDGIIDSGNIHAIRLKEADMSDNYNHDRLKNLSEEQQLWFHQKYGTQINKLRRRISSSR